MAAWALLLCYCSSYSEIINGTTTNAASKGLTWTMTNILPAATGLTVDGVIYQYTVVKNQIDPLVISIQNKNALQSGYIFRNQDDWSGLRGNTIAKVVPVDNIPINYWGPGEIKLDGFGEVKNPSVVYKYRYDTCVDPLSSPSCPGYAEAMARYLSIKAAEPIDPLSNEYVRNAIESKVTLEEEKKALTDSRKTNDKSLNEKKLIPVSPLSAEDAEKVNMFDALNNIPGFDLYKVSIPGGVYNDVLSYPDKKLLDSRRARSLGLAQEALHKNMVDSQYKKQ
mgnify:CR=1 FL=1